MGDDPSSPHADGLVPPVVIQPGAPSTLSETVDPLVAAAEPEVAGGDNPAAPVSDPTSTPEQEHAPDATTGQGTAPAPSPVAAPTPSTSGGFEAFVIGDPGSARSVVVPKPDPLFPFVPDTSVDGFTLSDGDDERVGLQVRAASVRGLSHRHKGTARQDAYANRVTDDGKFLVVAVADGVSAGRSSHVAARIAAESAVTQVAGLLAETPPGHLDWEHVFGAVSAAIVAEYVAGRPSDPAHHHQAAVEPGAVSAEPVATTEPVDSDDLAREVRREMATTLAVAVVSVGYSSSGLYGSEVDDTRMKVHSAWLAWMGDTSIWQLSRSGHWLGETDEWVHSGSGRWQPASDVKNEGAEIASSAVRALPAPGQIAVSTAQVGLPPESAILLMTDGVGDPLRDGTGLVGHTLAELWLTAPEPIAFAAQVDFARKTFDDDRTVVGVWGRGAEPDEVDLPAEQVDASISQRQVGDARNEGYL